MASPARHRETAGKFQLSAVQGWGPVQNLLYAAERGHRRDDIRPGLRIIGFERRVTIAFMVQDQRATFLRIFYGGRNWEEVMS